MMGYLKYKTVYLCGNIQRTQTSDFGTGWRDEITPTLRKMFNVKVINPCTQGIGDTASEQKRYMKMIKDRDFKGLKSLFYRVIRKDLRAVDKADFLIFYHFPNLPTVGSIHEIINAVNQKKPVLVVVKESLIDQLNPWLLTLIKPQWLFTSFDDMYAYLKKINSGDIDSSHWW